MTSMPGSWLTALVFDSDYPPDGIPSAGSSLPLSDGSTRSGWAGALVLRWNRADSRPRYYVVPGDSDATELLEVVFSEVFDAPLLDAASGHGPIDVPSPLQALGIASTFVNKLRDTLVPRTWALLILADPAHVDDFLNRQVERRPVARTATTVAAPGSVTAYVASGALPARTSSAVSRGVRTR